MAGFPLIMDVKPYFATFSGEIHVLPFALSLGLASLKKLVSVPWVKAGYCNSRT